MTISRPVSLPTWRKTCSDSHLEIAYASLGLGRSSSRNGANSVLSPLTLIVLTYTKRLTPAAAAILANLSVPTVLTSLKSAIGFLAVSLVTCTRAAKWMTTSTPARARDQSVEPSTDGISIFSAPSGTSAPEATDRCEPLTFILRLNADLQTTCPTKPLPPVTKIEVKQNHP